MQDTFRGNFVDVLSSNKLRTSGSAHRTAIPHQGALPFLPTAREGNVFTGVRHSVHNRPHAYSVTAHPCWLFVHCYGAVGTHPTGMLSCFWGARMPHAMRIFAKGLTFFHIVFFFLSSTNRWLTDCRMFTEEQHSLCSSRPSQPPWPSLSVRPLHFLLSTHLVFSPVSWWLSIIFQSSYSSRQLSSLTISTGKSLR